MTKKELLSNEIFKALPKDAEIVFATGNDILHCVPVNFLNLSVIQEGKKTALMIDAIPYWYLKERYNVTFEEKKDV